MARKPDPNRLESPFVGSEARFRAVLASSLDPLVTIDMQGTIVAVSVSVYDVFGYEPHELIGKGVTILMPEQFRAAHIRGLARYRSTGTSTIVGGVRELEVLRKDGSVITCELSFSRADIPGEPEPLITGSFRDITKRKEAEKKLARIDEQLRALATELVVAEERERRQLAVDVHDDLAQTIALLKIKVATLRDSGGVALDESLKEIERLVGQASDTVSSLTFKLSPAVLYDLGLGPALEWLVEDIQRRYGLHVTLEGDSEVMSFDQPVSITLFRAVRELLINVAKHSQVDKAAVRLRRNGRHFCITVEDEGIGFDPGALDSAHFGLFSIRERLRHMGGHVEICSATGQGTAVTISAPSTLRS